MSDEDGFQMGLLYSIIENYKDFPKCFGKPAIGSNCAASKDYPQLAAVLKNLCEGHRLSIYNKKNLYYQGPKKING